MARLFIWPVVSREKSCLRKRRAVHPLSSSVSVVIPVFNEATTLPGLIERIGRSGACELIKEIVIVDDGSSDGSARVAEELELERRGGVPTVRSVVHPRNRGKGAAVRTGLGVATGAIILVQDADLEYDPAEYPALIAPFSDPAVQVVYGSRNLQRNPRSSWLFYWGGRLLSCITNVLYGSRITDEATGYKLVRTGLMRELDLRADGFDFCPELTGKLLKRGIKIHEVPISYHPRSRAEGKKIRSRDGWAAIWMLCRQRFGRKK